jgi:hypothetical protein
VGVRCTKGREEPVFFIVIIVGLIVIFKILKDLNNLVGIFFMIESPPHLPIPKRYFSEEEALRTLRTPIVDKYGAPIARPRTG